MDTNPQETSGNCPHCHSAKGERRCFIAWLAAAVLGAIVYLPAAVAGLVALFNPLRQQAQGGKLFRLTTLDNLPADGTPQRFSIVADRSDGWTRYPKDTIGAVFLRRTGPRGVEALHVVCPHNGCYVQFETAKNEFYCPCHRASFEISGKRIGADCPSPRDLDTLEVSIEGQEVSVNFQNFRIGTPKKIPDA